MADEPITVKGTVVPAERMIASRAEQRRDRAEQRSRRLCGWLGTFLTDMSAAMADRDWAELGMTYERWLGTIAETWADAGITMADQVKALSEAGISTRSMARMPGTSKSAVNRAITGADAHAARKRTVPPNALTSGDGGTVPSGTVTESSASTVGAHIAQSVLPDRAVLALSLLAFLESGGWTWDGTTLTGPAVPHSTATAPAAGMPAAAQPAVRLNLQASGNLSPVIRRPHQ